MLNSITYGMPSDGTPGLLIVHGLYGSARNWGVIAKRLSDQRQVVAVDMRNHGNSPWFDTHSYEDMAGDLVNVLETLPGKWNVMGHSMGGKAAMMLAFTRPDLIERLAVVDIAPVGYAHTQAQYIKAMQSVDLAQVERRSDAANLLAPYVDNPALVPFFLQSLDVAGKRWHLNLDVLAHEMPKIIGFPQTTEYFDGPTLFLSGVLSDYILPEYRPIIKSLFPTARFAKIPGAGHWIHAEKPREFEAALRGWFN